MTSDAHVADPSSSSPRTAASSRACPPSGNFVVVHAVLVCELADGLIWRVRAFFDAYDAAVQLGVMPARGSWARRRCSCSVGLARGPGG